MDYTQAALKLICAQLKEAKQTPSQNSFTLGGILFQRAWLQGVLVTQHQNQTLDLFLDDGSGIVQLSLSADFLISNWIPGMYVMVVGGYFLRPGGDLPIIKVHKIVDLSAFPDREAMWYLEVMEAYNLFYKPLIEELE